MSFQFDRSLVAETAKSIFEGELKESHYEFFWENIDHWRLNWAVSRKGLQALWQTAYNRLNIKVQVPLPPEAEELDDFDTFLLFFPAQFQSKHPERHVEVAWKKYSVKVRRIESRDEGYWVLLRKPHLASAMGSGIADCGSGQGGIPRIE